MHVSLIIILIILIILLIAALILIFITRWPTTIGNKMCEGCGNCNDTRSISIFDIYKEGESWTRIKEFEVLCFMILSLCIILIMYFAVNDGKIKVFLGIILGLYLVSIYSIHGYHIYRESIIDTDVDFLIIIKSCAMLSIVSIGILCGLFFRPIFNVIAVSTLILTVLYTLFQVIYTCGERLECDTVQDKDDCLGAPDSCSSDYNKVSEVCGSCHIDKDGVNVNVNAGNVTECETKEGEWTSQMSSCYWVSDSESSDSQGGECVYDINKCSVTDCSKYQTTNAFEECCDIDKWEKFMDNDTLESIKEDNDKLGQGGSNLQAEHTLKRASSAEFHRRDELESGLYD